MKYMFNKLALVLSTIVATCTANVASALPAELVLNSDNVIVMNQEFDDMTTSAVMKQAQDLDAKLKSHEPIYLVLYTPGGSIQSGLELIEFMNGLNRPVHTITIFAASMGFQTVQGLKGNRYITKFGTLMAHKAKGGFSGEFPGQIDSRYVYYLKRLNELDEGVVKRSGGKYKSTKEWQSVYANEYWVDGFNAVTEGLADAVVSLKCDHSLNGNVVVPYNFMGFTIMVTFSKCPAIQGPLGIEAQIHTNKGVLSLTDFLAKGGVFPKEPIVLPSGTTTNESYTYYNSDALIASIQGLTVEKINAKVAELREKLKYNHSTTVKEY